MSRRYSVLVGERLAEIFFKFLLSQSLSLVQTYRQVFVAGACRNNSIAASRKAATRHNFAGVAATSEACLTASKGRRADGVVAKVTFHGASGAKGRAGTHKGGSVASANGGITGHSAACKAVTSFGCCPSAVRGTDKRTNRSGHLCVAFVALRSASAAHGCITTALGAGNVCCGRDWQ